MSAKTKALIAANAVRWSNASVLSAKSRAFASTAKKLVAEKARYLAVEARTGVPWFVIAVIHQRESSQRWDRSIAQGDPWNRVSKHVPKGRGPFNSWEDAAYDALMNCNPFAGKWKDWSAGGAMTLLEHYNGLGYANKRRPSPYVWAGTDQYSKGKYVADGVYDANHVDTQLGCAGIILAMAKLDSSVTFEDGVQARIVSPEAVDDGADSRAVAPAAVEPAPTTSPVILKDAKGDPDLFSVQTRLKAIKYSPGGLDGIWGGMTAGAITGFINDRGGHIDAPTSFEMFGEILPELKAELSRAEAEKFTRPVTEERAEGKAEIVTRTAPEAVPVRRNFLATAWASALTFLYAIFNAVSGYVSTAWDFFTDHKEDLSNESGFLRTALSYVGMVPTTFWFLLIAGGLAYVAFNSFSGLKTITNAVQSGERQ